MVQEFPTVSLEFTYFMCNQVYCKHVSGCLFAVVTGVHVFISGESLHCFLVGANKSYVIATSDL